MCFPLWPRPRPRVDFWPREVEGLPLLEDGADLFFFGRSSGVCRGRCQPFPSVPGSCLMELFSAFKVMFLLFVVFFSVVVIRFVFLPYRGSPAGSRCGRSWRLDVFFPERRRPWTWTWFSSRCFSENATEKVVTYGFCVFFGAKDSCFFCFLHSAGEFFRVPQDKGFFFF